MRRTLEVFEHARIDVEANGLTPHELDTLVRWNDLFKGRYFRVGHRHLRTRHFVGFMQVGDLAIEILPKADRDAPGDATPWRDGLIEMLRVTGLMNLEHLPTASQALSRLSLIELIARAFLAEVERLLREGLAKSYRTVESNQPVFRGRLKVAEHLRANLVRADRVYVEHTVFDHHALINRIVLAALDALSWCALPNDLALRIEACAAQFPELAIGGIDSTAIDRVHLGRSTQRYAQALVYARLILAHQGPALRSGRERVFALLFDMNALWERFIAALLRRAAPPGVTIESQASLPFWLPRHGKRRWVRPDIIVRDVAETASLVIDTKWKVPDDNQPDDDDLKQMFVYNELLGCNHAWLLYPATAISRPTGGSFERRRHGCETHYLGVISGHVWRDTHSLVGQLRGVLDGIFAANDRRAPLHPSA